MKAYTLNDITSSSAPPMANEKGKGTTLEGTLLVNDIRVRVLFDTKAIRTLVLRFNDDNYILLVYTLSVSQDITQAHQQNEDRRKAVSKMIIS